MAHNKKGLLTNNKYVLLHENTSRHFFFIKDDAELNRQIENGDVKDGDVVIELTPETVKVAQLKNFIQLK